MRFIKANARTYRAAAPTETDFTQRVKEGNVQ